MRGSAEFVTVLTIWGMIITLLFLGIMGFLFYLKAKIKKITDEVFDANKIFRKVLKINETDNSDKLKQKS
jgi:hypothetical protein